MPGWSETCKESWATLEKGTLFQRKLSSLRTCLENDYCCNLSGKIWGLAANRRNKEQNPDLCKKIDLFLA